MKSVDLFVVGGGSGGVRAARIAATHGAKVALAEEYRMGGTCVIRGCVPKKLMVMASRFSDEFEASKGFGWEIEKAEFSWPKLMERVHAEVTRLEGIYASNLSKVGVEIFKDRATLLDAHTVKLSQSGDTFQAKNILIATGARANMPDDFPGAQLAESSNEFFLWPDLPSHVVVQGAGYIALELACLMQRLGSKVTLVSRGEWVLRGFDQQLREFLQQQLVADGLTIKTSASITAITQDDNTQVRQVRLSDGSVLLCDRVLRATGRIPNSSGLGLESAGLTLGENGAIPVNEFSATKVASIYAVGDVTDRVTLTPAAIREGHAFADSVFGKTPRPIVHDVIPTAVFTTPEVGTVGLSEEEARKRYPSISIYSTRFRTMKTVLAGQQQQCFMKIIVDQATDRVLGVHLIGNEVGEMIQLVGIAIQMKATKADFDATLAVHPTIAEELVTMRTAQSS